MGLIGVITYPQIRQFAHGIPPEADAAFNIWRLAWVVHQLPRPFDAIEGRHIYDSLFHWQPLLNGISGFFPPSYLELLEQMRTFPDAQSAAYLKSRNVHYVVARKRLFEPSAYLRLRDALSRQSVLRLVAGFPETTGESLVYEVPR